MRYRLGRFTPKPGSRFFDSLHQHPRLAPLLKQALQEMLQVPLSPAPPTSDGTGAQTEAWKSLTQAPNHDFWYALEGSGAPAPVPLTDLRTVLPNKHPDRVCVEAIHRRLEDLSQRIEIRLLACEHEPGPRGFLAIAATSPSVSAQVRPHDTVWAGFAALRQVDGGVRILARVFRLVCLNCSLVSTHEDGVETAGGAWEDAVERCFDRGPFVSVVAGLREMASQGLPDPRPMLDEFGYMMHRDVIEQRWSEGDDRTVYGLVNAMTSVARDLPDLRERLDLEEMAGSLARLKRPPRPRRAAPALTPTLV